MDSKPWYASKTLWVNLLTLIAAVAGAFGIDVGLDDETKATIVAGALAVVNVVLRLVTEKPVTLTKQ